MKKYLLSIVFAWLSSVVCLAAGPGLACEGLFVERLIRNEHTDVSIITSADGDFRSMTVNGDKKIVAEIVRAMEADRKKASNVIEKYTGKNGYQLILNVPYKGNMISVGFDKYSDQDARIFMSGSPSTFGK